MPSWSQQYTAKSALLQQAPVYVLVVLDHYGAVDTYTAGTEKFKFNTAYTFAEHPGPLILFNRDGWELADPYDWSGGPPISTVYATRAQYGTNQATIGVRDSIGTVRAMFSAGMVTGADAALDIKSGYMSMPSGLSQTLDLVHGRLTTDGVRLDIQDRNGDVTRLMKSNPLIGRQAMLLGGYAGMAFADYSFLHVGRIDEVKIRDGTVYGITLDDPTRKLAKKLFGYLDGWSNALNKEITDSDTSLTYDLRDGPNDDELTDTNSDQVAAGYYAGHHLRIQGTGGSDAYEYVRLNTNGIIHGIIRGQLGTDAVAHGGSSNVTLAFAVEDNPIDILLGFLLNDSSFTLPRDYSNLDGYQLVWDSVIGWDATGVGVKRADLDLESFETIRNDWFPDYMMRLIINRGENMKPFIEKHLLKPYGLCLYLNNNGQLALGIMRPALPVTALTPTLNADDIIGQPEIGISSADIVNEVTVNFDYNPDDREYDADPITVIDQGSQTTYDYTGAITIDARGLVTGWFNGEGKALHLARRKRQRFSDPNPAVPLEVLISNKNIEPMSIVRVVHDGLPDPYAGTVGWDKYVLVVGKRIRWDTGTLVLDVVDTGYGGKRYCTIAPSGTADYVDATDGERQNYGFVGDSIDQMSDGTDAYQIM